ncbi:MAG TPA: trypsin-like peptidase domain-containing protein [Candidatus Saccharimonadales bacterium]|nr:trypsin-like peptidase domain-containing protein [Candidatus Saccharimonadales bacterium]
MTDFRQPDDADDQTRRHDLPAGSDPTAAGAPTPGPGGVDRYSPAPEARPQWSRHDNPMPTTPERWYEPVPATPTPATGPVVAPVRRGSSRAGSGSVVAAALLSAILASGGTVVALNASGALDQAVPAAATPSGTQVGATQPVTIDESSATIAVAAKVSPAVVRITTSGSVDTNQGVIPESGVGSGVIYDANGWILTNRHVVEGSDELEVELLDGRSFTGTVYGIDTLTDLAIVKVDTTGLPTAALGDSDALKVGQLVVAIGSPLGTYSNSVTSGIVSAKGRSITTDGNQSLNNLIQTDAAINPGNSGGPLLDANGSVVGINTAIAADSNGIGFAIPIDIARPIMEQAVAGEELARPYIGIRYVTITRKLADSDQLPVADGALIRGGDGGGPAVEPGTPAADAGLQDGDIIAKVDGQSVDGDHPLDATLSQFAPGDTVALEILRDGSTISVSVTLGTRPENP